MIILPSLQPILENDSILLRPLQQTDFELLYAVASDPSIWLQHPNKDRWKREVFSTFFEGALASKGAYTIVEKKTKKCIGSTRFYWMQEYPEALFIGYTFYAIDYWGKGINPMVKAMMLEYAFQFVSTVYFHIGAQNIRSQIAIQRLGAVKIAEKEIAYYGEPSRLNYLFSITKTEWELKKG